MDASLNDMAVATAGWISQAACKAGIDAFFKDIYANARDSYNALVGVKTLDQQIANLSDKAWSLRHVKTILWPDARVDITKFYIPTTLCFKVDGAERLVQVHDISMMACGSHVLIQGSAGQGKSSFLRYLALREFALGNKLPLFVELRRASDGFSVMDLIVQECTTLGLAIDENVFHSLCDNRRVALFLDAFDEVPEGRRQAVLAEIEQIVRRHRFVNVYVTSRPNSGISASPHLEAAEIAEISGTQYRRYIARFSETEHAAKRLVDGVERSSVRGLLTTPLMVALLVLIYRIEELIPETEQAFYADLFTLLVRRHDSNKGSFLRQRKSTLGDKALRDLFCALSFFCQNGRAK